MASHPSLKSEKKYLEKVDFISLIGSNSTVLDLKLHVLDRDGPVGGVLAGLLQQRWTGHLTQLANHLHVVRLILDIKSLRLPDTIEEEVLQTILRCITVFWRFIEQLLNQIFCMG